MDNYSNLEDVIMEVLHSINNEINNENNEDMFEKGLLDSLGIADFVALIEERLDIEIDAEDIVPENFISAKAIHLFLSKEIVNGGNKV